MYWHTGGINLHGAKARINPLVIVLSIAAFLLFFHYGVELSSAAPSASTGATANSIAGKVIPQMGRFMGLTSLIGALNEFLQTMLQSGIAIATMLVPTGMSLLIAISATMLAWYSITWILGGELEGIIKAFITFILTWGLAKYALDTYPTFVGYINDGFVYILSTIGIDTSNYLNSLFGLAGKTWDSVTAALNEGKADAGVIDVALGGASIFVDLAGYLAAIILSVLIYLVGAIVAAFIAVSQVMLAIAVALGPIMIPFMILPPLSNIATGWLNFMVYAGFVKLVGGVMTVLLSAMIQPALGLTFHKMVDGSVDFDWGVFFGVMVLCVISALMALYIMPIAKGLVGGPLLQGLGNAMSRGGQTASSMTGVSKGGAAAAWKSMKSFGSKK